MKTILILSTVFLLSCEKCYECSTTYTQKGTSLTPTSGTTTQEFCGTEKEKEEYEEAGTMNSTATSGGYTITQTYYTTCK